MPGAISIPCSPSGATWQVPEGFDLDRATHSLTVSLRDRAGNEAVERPDLHDAADAGYGLLESGFDAPQFGAAQLFTEDQQRLAVHIGCRCDDPWIARSRFLQFAPALEFALDALDADRDFLKAGGVFSDDQIDAYMELKWEEIYAYEHTPHPVEYKMYYSC